MQWLSSKNAWSLCTIACTFRKLLRFPNAKLVVSKVAECKTDETKPYAK